MNARRSDLERAANEFAASVEVDDEQVAAVLVRRIVDEHMEAVLPTMPPTDAVDNGVAEAVEEFDEESFSAVVDLVSERVHLEVESQAKRIALRLLGEMAAQARREASVAAE